MRYWNRPILQLYSASAYYTVCPQKTVR